MGSYWEEVKGVIKKGANLAADEIKKDFKIAVEKAKEKIDSAADDIKTNTETIKGKSKVTVKNLDEKKKRDFEMTLDKAKKSIDKAIVKIKESTDSIADKAKVKGEKLAGKAKESAQYLKYRTNLYIKHKELEEVLADLGDSVFVAYKEKKDIYADEKIKGLVVKAEKLEKRCREMEKKIAELP